MVIEVNRRKITFVEGESIPGLLKRMSYTFPLVIIKVDGKIIQKKDQKDLLIVDGMKIDVIHLTSGG